MCLCNAINKVLQWDDGVIRYSYCDDSSSAAPVIPFLYSLCLCAVWGSGFWVILLGVNTSASTTQAKHETDAIIFEIHDRKPDPNKLEKVNSDWVFAPPLPPFFFLPFVDYQFTDIMSERPMMEDRRANLQRMKSKRVNLKRTQTIRFAAAKHDHLLNAVTWDVFAPPPSNSIKVSPAEKG